MRLLSIFMSTFVIISQVVGGVQTLEASTLAPTTNDIKLAKTSQTVTQETSTTASEEKTSQTVTQETSTTASEEKTSQTGSQELSTTASEEYTNEGGNSTATSDGHKKNFLQGKWGTSPWWFDDDMGTLTIDEGTLSDTEGSPWNRKDDAKIDSNLIKKIVFKGKVVAPEVSSFLFSSVTNSFLSNLVSIEGLAYLDTSAAENMMFMFAGCSNLSSLDLSNFDTRKLPVNGKGTSGLFLKCLKLQSLDLGTNFRFEGSSLIDSGMSGNEASIKFQREDDNYSQYYGVEEFEKEYGKGKLTPGKYSIIESMLWGTSNCGFNRSTKELSIEAGKLSEAIKSPWNRTDSHVIDPKSIKKIVLKGEVIAPVDSSSLFSTTDPALGLISVEELEGLSFLRFDDVTKVSNMFRNMKSLETIDLSSVRPGKIEVMDGLFDNCAKLKSVDIPRDFGSNKLVNTSKMFNDCKELTTIDLTKFDTGMVRDMSLMFNNCRSLETLDLTGEFNTLNVTNMYHMYSNTRALKKLVLSLHINFQSNAGLGVPVPESGKGTGNWIRKESLPKGKGYSPKELMAKYGRDLQNWPQDMYPGTFVAEVAPKKSQLSLSSSTNKDKYTIGDKINITVVIKHTSGSEDDSEAKSIKLRAIINEHLWKSLELQNKITIETYDSSDRKIDSKENELVDNLSLPDLKKGNYYKVVISGEAINNTNPSVESNYSFKLSYSPDGVENNVATTIYKNIEIDSGDLKFSSVPDKLEFVTTPFSIDLNNKLIGRSDTDWQLKVSDSRGTVPYGENNTVDRKNWNVYATADAFKDEKGMAVSDGALSTTYVQGDKQTDLSSDETLIASHDVDNETPKANPETVIKWDETEGIKAVVHNRNKLDANKKYSSDMTFELRLEP